VGDCLLQTEQFLSNMTTRRSYISIR